MPDEQTIALDELERRVLETLARVQQADLGPYDTLDVANLFRKIATQREQVMRQLQGMIENLDQVAGLLRALPTVLHDSGEGLSRERIAADFTRGARSIEQARASLQAATQDLEYLEYRLL